MPVVWIVVVAVWVGLASATGSLCRMRGHDGLLGFLISLFCSPVLGFLYAGALPDRHQEIEAAERSKRLSQPVPDPVVPPAKKVRCSQGCETYPRPGTWCPKCGTKAPE